MPGTPSLPLPRQTDLPVHKRRFGLKVFLLFCSLIAIAFIFYSEKSPSLVSIKSTHPDFVGRKEILKRLKEEIIDKKQVGLPVVVLWGEGGIGKSESAIAFANANLEKFSLVYWIGCGSAEIYRNSYIKLAEQLNISFDPKDPIEKIRERVHVHLHNFQSNKPWLLIFDNVEECLELPERGNGKVIITSRTKVPFERNVCIQIPYFSDEEALLLVKGILPEEEEVLARNLINSLDHFPLALNQVAHYIKNIPGMNIRDYLGYLQKNSQAWLNDLPGDERYPFNLNTHLQLGIQNLSEHSLTLYRWLAICAYLHPDHIPSHWIESWLSLDAEGKKTSEEIEIEANQIKRALVNQAHMRFNAKEKSFSIHRLKQEAIKSDHSIDQQELQRVVFRLLSDQIMGLDEMDDLEWHHERWDELHYWEINATWFLERANLKVPNEHLFTILNGLVNYYTVIKGDFQKAIQFFETASLLQPLFYPDQIHPSIALILRSAAFTFFELGEYHQALEMNQKALAILNKMTDPEMELGRAHTLIGIGTCYSWLNLPQESLKFFEKAYEIALKIFPQTPHLLVAEILKWIGVNYCDLGDYDLALEYQLKALQINRCIYGEQSNIQRAFIHGCMGFTYRKLKKYKEALIQNLEDWRIIQVIYKRNVNLPKLMTIKNIAIDFCKLKKYKHSIEWSEKGLKLAADLYRDRPHVITSYILENLSIVYSELNYPKEAKIYQEKYLKMKQNLEKVTNLTSADQ